MTLMKRISCYLIVFGLLFVTARSSLAQSDLQTNRSFVASPKVLGMGDAGVALASKRTAFFYNPAHLGRSASLLSINIVGASGSISNSVVDQARFFNDRLQPAIDAGIDNLTDSELRSLYEEAFAQGQQRASLNSQFLLPSVIVGMHGVGVGGGLFATTGLNYRIRDAGLRLPQLDIVGRTDLMGVATAGVDLEEMVGVSGLAVGLTGKYTRRFLTIKDKPIDAFSTEENIYVLEGRSLGFDVGVLYDVGIVPTPGTLTLGATIYDMLASDFDYVYYGMPEDLPLLGEQIGDGSSSPVDARRVEQEEAYANERYALSPSYRVGVAYQPPGIGFLGNLGFAADYIGYRQPLVDQSFLAHLHLGAQLQLLRLFKVRGGFSQGYPTVGGGLGLGLVHVDYAYHGVEDGRIPGQIYNQRHTAQVVVGF